MILTPPVLAFVLMAAVGAPAPTPAVGVAPVDEPRVPSSAPRKALVPRGWVRVGGGKRGVVPTNRGGGLLITAGVLGGVGLALKLAATGLAIRNSGQGSCDLICDGTATLIIGEAVYSPLLGVSLGFLGAGMGLRGRWRAYTKGNDGTPPLARLHPAVGWSLLGAGVALWGVSRRAGLECRNDRCFVVAWETTYYPSTALVASGMVLGAFATAYNRHTRHINTQITAAPMLGKRLTGLSLSGALPW